MAGLCEGGNEPPGSLKARVMSTDAHRSKQALQSPGEPERFTAERKETDERGSICRLVELYSGMHSMDKGKRTY
ncbi:hypothetical protein ANN_11816 [Periplaneta americana]|uniref:Uncharacterized protein n=1 Tax=Periplaneta americana TaxID=6978 RepID=A0ABQ8T7W9_PERAM|nr:hypothetical protein ANN_11816 [Periplaneta americana]